MLAKKEEFRSNRILTNVGNRKYVKERDEALGDSHPWSRERFEDVASTERESGGRSKEEVTGLTGRERRN